MYSDGSHAAQVIFQGRMHHMEAQLELAPLPGSNAVSPYPSIPQEFHLPRGACAALLPLTTLCINCLYVSR